MTGVLLNHAEGLSLNERRVTSSWVLNRYGMGLTGEPLSFPAKGQTVTGWGGNLFLNGESLELSGEIVGAVEASDGIGVFCSDRIHLVSLEGDLIESLEEGTLPEGRVTSVSTEGRIMKMSSGELFRFYEDYIDFEAITGSAADPSWSVSVPTSEGVRRKIEQSYHGGGLPWSRLLLDLHSGRFFGPTGRWIVDICVVLLVFLSITGLRLGLRNRRGTPS